MKIIKSHYKLSKPVTHYREIKEEAEELKRFVERGAFEGYYNKAYSLSHCQVSETPFAFWVAAQECINEGMFKHRVIINPQILEAREHKVIAQPDGKSLTIPNKVEYQEPCMSFPFRKPKRLMRFDVIKVRYQVPGWFGLKTVERLLTGIASEIFQHEYDHTQGKNLYFESEAPIKWWELAGTDQPRDFQPAKEYETERKTN